MALSCPLLVLSAVYKVLRATKARRVRLVQPVRRVLRAKPVQLALRVLRVKPVQPALKVLRARQVQPALRVLRVKRVKMVSPRRFASTAPQIAGKFPPTMVQPGHLPTLRQPVQPVRRVQPVLQVKTAMALPALPSMKIITL